MDIALNKFFAYIKGQIYSYNEFIDKSVKLLKELNPDLMHGKDKQRHNYRKLNMQRTNRINKTFRPNTEIVELIKQIKDPQFWLVITEDWCGDSAQNLPYIINYSRYNSLIDLKVILRDENLEAVDNFFNHGNPRSIPKIVGFDQYGAELFIWGPRPKFAQDLVGQLKAEGYSKEEFNNELHLWYTKNKGKELEKELYAILTKIVNN